MTETAGFDQSKIYMDFKGFNDLRRGAKNDDPKALQAVAKQFEALFLQMIMKSMRSANSMLSDNSFLNSDSVQFYEKMYDQQLAMELSGTTGLGLSDMLVRQLSQPESSPKKSGATDLEMQLEKIKVTTQQTEKTDKTNSATEKSAPVLFNNPVDFVKSLWNDAVKVAKELGVDPKILVAQAALETGWGKYIIKDKQGNSSFNLFNIKTGSTWEKNSVAVNTLEYENGLAIKKTEPFRQYDNFAESFSDYLKLLQKYDRYDHALDNAGDAKAFIHSLQKAGYATDPNYANKIYSIYQGDELNSAIKEMEAK